MIACFDRSLTVAALFVMIGTSCAPAQEPATPTATVAWKYTPPGAEFEGVIARGGLVIALDRAGAIHALDAATGTPRWHSADKVPLSFGYGMAFSGRSDFDAVFVGCDTGLLALDRRTGAQLWQTPIAKGVNGPACTDDLVFAAGADGQLYACDLKTGHLRWQHDFLEDRPADPPGLDGANARFDGRPARPGCASTDGDIVTLSIFDQCRTIAVDARTGARRWSFVSKGWMYGTPTFGTLNVFVGSQDGRFYAVDHDTGKLSWEVTTKSRVEASAATDARFVYFGSCDGDLYTVDQTVGRVAWHCPTDPGDRGTTPIYARPLVQDDTVLLATLSGMLYAIDRKSGARRWKFTPDAHSLLTSELATDGGLLFVTTGRDPVSNKGHSAVFAIRAP